MTCDKSALRRRLYDATCMSSDRRQDASRGEERPAGPSGVNENSNCYAPAGAMPGPVPVRRREYRPLRLEIIFV